MYSIRKWLYKPKRTDPSLLAQFYYADEELNMVATELDSFDGRKDPERCASLVNQLRVCQDKVLTYIQKIMDEAIDVHRATRDFRVKFPDDVLQESLAGQLWFGAECLAAGSSIMNREVESASMRPLARALTKNLDSLRAILRDQCLRNINTYTDRINEALVIFDKLFAEFELSYVSAMVPVKTMKEYDLLQEVIVLFSESVQRSLKLGLLTLDMIDDYDPALMFTIPRLAIVSGLLIYPEGPLNPDNDPFNMPEMFRPFQTLLYKIRELLYTLSKEELITLEKALCSPDEPTARANPGESSENSEELHTGEDNFSQIVSSALDDQASGNVPYQAALDGPIIIHTPNSGSPVTPINEDEHFSLGLMSQSPSIVTIIAQNHSQDCDDNDTDFVSPTEDQREFVGVKVQQQDSSDSGLQSENTSLSDNAADSGAENSGGGCQREGPTTPDRLSFSNSSQNEICDKTSALASDEETQATIKELCCHCNCSLSQSILHVTTSQESNMASSCLGNTEVLPSGENGNGGDMDLTSDEVVVVCSSSSASDRDVYDNREIPQICVCPASSETENSDSDNTNSSETISDSGTLVQCSDQISVCPVAVEGPSRAGSLPKPAPARSLGECSNAQLCMDPSHFSDKINKVETVETFAGQIQTRQSKRDDLKLCNSNMRSRMRGRSATSFEKLKGKPGMLKESEEAMSGEFLDVPRLQSLRYAADSISSSCSSCRTGSSVSSECDWDHESCASSETSSYNSECHDDEEIALAIQAAELASRNEARSRFKSSSDLIHRLFVCISGVADQLQTNYASDLRNILKSVFDLNCSEPLILADNLLATGNGQSLFDPDTGAAGPSQGQGYGSDRRQRSFEEPPPWVPDEESRHCSSCKILFTLVRRRHHCRNCGKIYCSRCSSNAVPLPHFGHTKPVRVCNHCFMFQVTPFTMARE